MEASVDKLYPIYGVTHEPFWQTPFFYMLVTLLAVLLILGVLFFILRFLYKSKPQKSWVVACARLNELKSADVTKDKGKLWYVTLIKTLKEYLRDRYGWDVVGLTDDEAIIFAQKKNFDPEQLEKLKAIFYGAILVKFANKGAIKEQAIRHLADAQEIVAATKPKDRQ